MTVLTWISIGALLPLFFLYLYWAWRESSARPAWVQKSFYAGVVLFAALFGILSVHTVSVIPARTHEQAMTTQVVSGKQAWQKYVCIDCHTVLGNGAYFAQDLTKAWNRFVNRAGGDEQAAHAALVAFLQNPPQATSGRRGMPAYGMPSGEAENLSAFLRWVSHIDTNGWPPEPVRPLREAAPPGERPVFSLHKRGKQLFDASCLVCHSIGAGRVVGPDLKELTARYDRAAVLQWMLDPDAVYKERGRKPVNAGFSTMPASRLNRDDAEAIADFLLVSAGKE